MLVRTGPSLPRGGTLVSSCPPPVSVLTVNLSCALGHSEGARECVRKYCVEYLYGEVWFFLLFSSSKGAPVLVALWDFPVSTDTLSTQIPKQSVPISLVHSFVWSGPPARLGLTEVPLPAPVTTCHSPRHCSSEVSWMPQPGARPEVSPLTWPAPHHLQAFSFCEARGIRVSGPRCLDTH